MVSEMHRYGDDDDDDYDDVDCDNRDDDDENADWFGRGGGALKYTTKCKLALVWGAFHM